MKTYTIELAIDRVEIYEVKAKSEEEAKRIIIDGEHTGKVEYGEEVIGEPIIVKVKQLCIKIKERLEYLRGEIEAERISIGELLELQSLAEHIDSGDTVLLEWAGVLEA